MKKTLLAINNYALAVHLGWPDAERKKPQKVLLDLTIEFNPPPKACLSDELKDTICYSGLINKIEGDLKGKAFHLIEHLAASIYAIIKSHIPKGSKITVRITKFPDIQGLTGGVYFSYQG